jgi:hypothetical protein
VAQNSNNAGDRWISGEIRRLFISNFCRIHSNDPLFIDEELLPSLNSGANTTLKEVNINWMVRGHYNMEED